MNTSSSAQRELPKWRFKIAPKGQKARSQIITESGNNRQEARLIVEGKYPNHEIIWQE